MLRGLGFRSRIHTLHISIDKLQIENSNKYLRSNTLHSMPPDRLSAYFQSRNYVGIQFFQVMRLSNQNQQMLKKSETSCSLHIVAVSLISAKAKPETHLRKEQPGFKSVPYSLDLDIAGAKIPFTVVNELSELQFISGILGRV